MRTKKLFFVTFMFCFMFLEINLTASTESAPYSLVWSDEFEVEGTLDETKWNFDIGNGMNGWGNGELQYFKKENAIVSNGILHLTALKQSHGGCAFTSAKIKTQGKFQFKYGKVEVRAKLPNGGGTWPAIWMLGTKISQVGWPACGEIDILEYAGNRPNQIQGSIHSSSSYGNTVNTQCKHLKNLTDDFHVYSMEWTPNKVKFFFDEQLYYTYQPKEKTAATWPFDDEMFLILNLSIGGTYGGKVDPTFDHAQFEIDYVRVYQK